MKPLLGTSELSSGQDGSPRRRDKAEDSERHRTRERLEATLAGLGELEYLRHRQEILVKAALSPGVAAACTDPTGKGDNPRSLEERYLEENILLLKKQLVGSPPGGVCVCVCAGDTHRCATYLFQLGSRDSLLLVSRDHSF